MDRGIRDATACHEKAIYLCDVGDMLRRFGKLVMARRMYKRAYILEKHAALIARRLDLEPSASILETSADSLKQNYENYPPRKFDLRLATSVSAISRNSQKMGKNRIFGDVSENGKDVVDGDDC